MSKRTGLLASVAMPLMSISLMAPAAFAAPSMPSVHAASNGAGLPIIQIQEQLVVPEAGEAPAEGSERKRRDRRAAEPGAEAPAEGGAEAPRARRGEATDGSSEEPRRPRREARPQEEAPAAREAAPAETLAEPKPETSTAPAAEPKAEQPAAAETKPETSPEASPSAEPTAEQPAASEAKPDASSTEPAAPAARSLRETPTGDQPRPTRSGTRTPAGDAPASEAPAARQAAPTEAPAATDPAAAPTATDPAAAPTATDPAAAPTATDPAATAPATTDPAATQRSAPATTGEAPLPPADPGSSLPAAVGGQQVQQPPGPQTPAEIDQAKKIAEDPASSNQTVVLPVENGAAVLDSAKESAPAAATQAAPAAPGTTRDGNRPRRDGQQAGAPVAPAAPAAPPPTSDADAQAFGGQRSAPVQIEPSTRERGERLGERPRYERARGFDDRRESDDGRVIIQLDNRSIVRHDDSRRFYGRDYQPEYERLRDGRTREIIERRGGVRIVTIRDRYGDIVQRSRIGEDGREYVLYYSPERSEPRGGDYTWRDPALDLPPMRLTIPVDQYIIDTSSEPDRDYYEFLEQPPVERVERVYSLDEVKYSARIRDKVRRIDLDTITFATGSAEIPMTQATSLRKVADAMKEVLEKDPSETFLIEGHTDAVGSDESNLVLSDRRAESVAVVLSDAFGIPPENLATQGYGERYLKVRTEVAEQRNRRVTIRRITALVKPVAQN